MTLHNRRCCRAFWTNWSWWWGPVYQWSLSGGPHASRCLENHQSYSRRAKSSAHPQARYPTVTQGNGILLRSPDVNPFSWEPEESSRDEDKPFISSDDLFLVNFLWYVYVLSRKMFLYAQIGRIFYSVQYWITIGFWWVLQFVNNSMYFETFKCFFIK